MPENEKTSGLEPLDAIAEERQPLFVLPHAGQHKAEL